MQLPFRTAKIFWLKGQFGNGGTGRPSYRRGLPLGVMVFAFLDDFMNKRISRHSITMAKTHATATLRQHAHTAGTLACMDPKTCTETIGFASSPGQLYHDMTIFQIYRDWQKPHRMQPDRVFR